MPTRQKKKETGRPQQLNLPSLTRWCVYCPFKLKHVHFFDTCRFVEKRRENLVRGFCDKIVAVDIKTDTNS